MDNHVGSFTIDEGVDLFGTHKQIIFEGDQIVTKRTFDAAPLLKQAAERRAATSADRWGEGLGTHAGIIPMAVYADAMAIQGNEARQKFILGWLRRNPAFVTFDKFLKK